MVAPGLAQHRRGEQRRGGAAAETAAGLVDHEHAIRIAIEREADVEATGHHPRLQVALVGRLQGVGRVVGERSVELAVHHLERDLRQALEHRWHDQATHAVGSVGHHAQRPQGGDVDERDHVVGERLEQVAAGLRAGGGGGQRAMALEHIACHALHLVEPGVDTHRASPAETELDAVVARGLCDAVNIAPGASSVPAA